MRTPRLVADDLVLEAPDVADAEDWSDAQDDECARWFGWPCRPGVERCRAHLERVANDLERVANDAEPGSFTWAIRSPAGFTGGIDLKLHEDRWIVSYFVHPAHRGRGIATRALRLVCGWAFDGLGLDVVSTRVRAGNAASLRVLAKVGFRPTGKETGDDGHVEVFHELAGSTRPRAR